MFDFYEKRKIRSLLYSKIVIAGILLLALWLGISTHERFVVEREMYERRTVKEVELEMLNERAADLKEKVEHLENNRGIEEELRNRFDVAKEGEQVIVIVDDDESSDSNLESFSQPPGSKKEEGSFFDFFKFW